MEPVSMLLMWVLNNPAAAVGTAKQLAAPGSVDQAKLQSSLADFAAETLKCHHKTARFQTVDVVGRNWSRQSQYGAEASIGLRIRYTGMSTIPYQMEVALLAKPGHLRTVVIADTAVVPYSKKCDLESWVVVKTE